MLQNKKYILYCCNNTICIKFLDVLIKTLYFILTHLIKKIKIFLNFKEMIRWLEIENINFLIVI